MTSHPDDESMFFAPALRHRLGDDRGTKRPDGSADRTVEARRRRVHVLCLSNGDYPPSDGAVRTKEMHRACSLLGADSGRVTVLDDARMKDGPDSVWDADRVSAAVLDHVRTIVPHRGDESESGRPSYLLSGPSPTSSNGTPDRSWEYVDEQSGGGGQPRQSPAAIREVDLSILTFDPKGVSGHPNHRDTYRGVRYLVNERCRNVRSSGVEGRVRSSLRLRRRADQTDGISKSSKTGEETEEIRLNIKVYTLRSVSNPVAKYFPFVEILLYHYLRQIVWRLLYLAYLLLGLGFLVKLEPERKPPSFWPAFTGTTCIDPDRPDETYQCRLMDPGLVRRAMAAHASQFVWYRRLSVAFSRYTYVNDLSRLEVDPSSVVTIDDDEDYDDGGLGPVATVQEEETVSDFLLTPAQMTRIRDLVLPTNLRHRAWNRVYSLSRDGDSFAAFQRLVGEWNSGSGGRSTLLVVKSACGGLFGGFADVPLVPSSEVRGSAHQSCLFRIRQASDEGKEEDDGPVPSIDVYGQDCATSTKRVVFDPSRRLIAFGGGYTDGPDEGFGLSMEDGFARGTTARCAAFRNEPLLQDGRDGVFDILDMEVWGFVFGQF